MTTSLLNRLIKDQQSLFWTEVKFIFMRDCKVDLL